MSQATPIIGANKSGLDYRQEDNDGKQALLNHHKGSAAPAYAEAGVIWLDDSATPWLLKLYDGADWVTLGALNVSTNMFTPYQGNAALRTLNYAADTGVADAYVLAPQPVISAYAAGQIVTLCPAQSNTGASTIAISALATRNIKLTSGADPAANALLAGGVYLLVYDGASFIVLNPETGGGGAALAVPAITQLTLQNNAATPNTKVDVTAANATMIKTDGTPVFDDGISLTLDFSTTGANGLDTGSLASSSFYHIWLISDSTTTATLASLSATAPTLPAGYLYKIRLGAVHTDGSSHLYRTRQRGNRSHYVVTPSTNTAAMPLMTSGVMGWLPSGVYASVSTAGVVPATAQSILLCAKTKGSLDGTGILIAPGPNYGLANSITNPPVCSAGSSYETVTLVNLPLETSNIYISATNNTYSFCHGWVDSVNAS